MLSISHSTEHDLTSGEKSADIFVRVYTTVFTSGIVAKIGATGFTTLMALATFMDEDGECYPTQDQLAERIGVHKNTVGKYINDLLEVRINEKPIVTRKKMNNGNGKIYSYYKIQPLSQLAIFNGQVAPVEATHKNNDIESGEGKGNTNSAETIATNNNSQELKKISDLNSNTAIKLFQEIYRDTYNVNYVVSNYGREGKLMKDKVITPYPELARKIIEIGVTRYNDLFRTAKYPRPTIAMFSWAVNQIIPVIEDEMELDELAAGSSEAESQAEKEMLEKLARLG